MGDVTAPAAFARRWAAEIGLLTLCLFLFFWRLGSIPLIDYDEALYVSCAKQMVVTGDWVTPRLNTRLPERPGVTEIAFFEKPIFVYWASASAMRVFGLNLWAARLPVALASLLTTLLVYLSGNRWFGRRAGLLAGLAYATAPMTLIDARQMTTDALLVFWLTIAMLCFWQAQAEGKREKGRQASSSALITSHLFWLMCGLAVLTKGVVGLLLPFLVIGVFLLLNRVYLRIRLRKTARPSLRMGIRMRGWRVVWTGISRLRPASGLLLFLLVAAPWHALIALRPDLDSQGRTWVQEYLLRQHIGRFRGLDTVHNSPVYMFFLYFLLGFFPWACFAPAAFRGVHHGDTEPQRNSQRRDSEKREQGEEQTNDSVSPSSFLATWFWTIFMFFSLGAAKLPTYIAPAYPAAALLLGHWLDRALSRQSAMVSSESDAGAVGIDEAKGGADARTGRSLRRGALAACGIGVVLLIGALAAPNRSATGVPIPQALLNFGMHVALLFTLGGGAAAICFGLAERSGAISPGSEQAGRFPDFVVWRMRGIGALTLMMTLTLGVIAVEGYGVVRDTVLGPYQELVTATRQDEQAGIPVLFYGIVPRRPSMLFYADYAPYEHKETPFLPFLALCLTPAQREADVIMSGRTYERQVLPEIQRLPGASVRILQRRGPADGWLLTRVFVPPGYVTPPLPRHKNTLWETITY